MLGKPLRHSPRPRLPGTGRRLHKDEGMAVFHAPAKINLTLEVLARRDDGMHGVRTVMVPLDLTDELIVDASDPPVDCGTVQAAFEAAERTAGASVTPIVGLPGGASATCSHQFGTSGYTMTIYSDPTSSDDGGGRQAFVQAACGAFMHLAGGG